MIPVSVGGSAPGGSSQTRSTPGTQKRSPARTVSVKIADTAPKRRLLHVVAVVDERDPVQVLRLAVDRPHGVTQLASRCAVQTPGVVRSVTNASHIRLYSKGACAWRARRRAGAALAKQPAGRPLVPGVVLLSMYAAASERPPVVGLLRARQVREPLDLLRVVPAVVRPRCRQVVRSRSRFLKGGNRGTGTKDGPALTVARARTLLPVDGRTALPRPETRGRKEKGVQWLTWPRSQNLESKPRSRRRASAHETSGLGNQSSACGASTLLYESSYGASGTARARASARRRRRRPTCPGLLRLDGKRREHAQNTRARLCGSSALLLRVDSPPLPAVQLELVADPELARSDEGRLMDAAVGVLERDE
jgi:hypothetical protein